MTKSLIKGQVWVMQDSRIEIVQVGKTLAHYKHYRGGQKRGGPTELQSIRSVLEFLTTQKAQLTTAE